MQQSWWQSSCIAEIRLHIPHPVWIVVTILNPLCEMRCTREMEELAQEMKDRTQETEDTTPPSAPLPRVMCSYGCPLHLNTHPAPLPRVMCSYGCPLHLNTHPAGPEPAISNSLTSVLPTGLYHSHFYYSHFYLYHTHCPLQPIPLQHPSQPILPACGCPLSIPLELMIPTLNKMTTGHNHPNYYQGLHQLFKAVPLQTSKSEAEHVLQFCPLRLRCLCSTALYTVSCLMLLQHTLKHYVLRFVLCF